MKEITTKELKELIDSHADFVLLDCRSQHYFNWEHLPGAQNLRWKYVLEKAEQMFPNKKTRIITYCDGYTCHISLRCFAAFEKLGYTNLVEYSGGMADWKANDLPTQVNSHFKIAPHVYRLPHQEFFGEQVGRYLVYENSRH